MRWIIAGDPWSLRIKLVYVSAWVPIAAWPRDPKAPAREWRKLDERGA